MIEQKPAKAVAEELNLSLNQVYVARYRMTERVRAMLLELTGMEFERFL